MNVEDVMTRDVVACRADDSLLRAAELLDEAGVPCLPVLAPGGGRRVVGVVTHRDLCRAAAHAAEPLAEVRLAAHARGAVRRCWPDDSVEAAFAIMRAHGARRLAVVDPEERLLGVVTLSDIARAALRGRSDADPADVVETLAALGAHSERAAA